MLMRELMMRNVYINSFGSFLPNDPVNNADMEEYLGFIGGKKSKYKPLVLRQNRIKYRHYALNKDGEQQYSSSEMAALAIKHAVNNSEIILSDISYLGSSSTLGDCLVPGLASHIHAELNIKPIEIANFQSVCGSSIMALKSGYLQIGSEEHDYAAISGCEFASRYFRPGFYEDSNEFLENGEIDINADFLRFTLSDGAGACILESKPNTHSRSLKINWIDIKSYADRFDTCMSAGEGWSNQASTMDAVKNGSLILKQDFSLLKEMIPVWVSHYLDLIDQDKINVDEIKYFCSHYSAHSLKEEAINVLKTTGSMITEDKWFSNLYSKGNTGTASIFIILEELYNSKELNIGDKILCHVPESGRCLNGLMMLEVV